MGHFYFKNSWYADKFKACVVLLSEAFQSKARACPTCWLFTRHRYKSAGVRSGGREGQETVRSTTSIDLCSENPKPALPRGEGGQELYHQQTTQSVVLSNSIWKNASVAMSPLICYVCYPQGVTSLISWNTQFLYTVTESTGLTLK